MASKTKIVFGTGDAEISTSNPLPVTPVQDTDVTPLFRYLDTDGDGTGTKDASVDYSGSPETELFIAPPSGKIYTINQMLISIVDTGAFDAGDYGNG